MTRVVWFHPRALLPIRGGGEVRVSGLVEAVVREGHEVLVVQPGALSTAPPEAFRILEVPARRGLGLAASKVLSLSPLRTARLTHRGRRSARREIATFAPEVAVVSELLSWPVAAPLLPPVPWIFDAHNVESKLFVEMAANASTTFDKTTLAIDRARVARQEARVVAMADAVIAVSPVDAQALAALRPGMTAPLVVPSSVPTPPEPIPLTNEPVVLFVGTLDFPPNTAAVEELVLEVMPRVRASVPEARLVIAGRRAPAAVRNAVEPFDWVELRENLPELESVYRSARCTVLPLRSGGGSRLKVYEALAHGLPVVGTARALSGIELRDDVAIAGESAEQLAEVTVSVLSNRALAAQLAQSSRSWFLERLSWSHAAAPLLALIEELA